MTLSIELFGLEVFGHHGVGEEERRAGQRLLYDVWIDVPDGALSDRIEDAVDYREVAAAVRDVSGARQYRLLEALAAAVADAIVERFPVTRARVRVRKPDVDLEPPVEYSAATVERRPRSGLSPKRTSGGRSGGTGGFPPREPGVSGAAPP